MVFSKPRWQFSPEPNYEGIQILAVSLQKGEKISVGLVQREMEPWNRWWHGRKGGWPKRNTETPSPFFSFQMISKMSCICAHCMWILVLWKVNKIGGSSLAWNLSPMRPPGMRFLSEFQSINVVPGPPALERSPWQEIFFIGKKNKN